MGSLLARLGESFLVLFGEDEANSLLKKKKKMTSSRNNSDSDESISINSELQELSKSTLIELLRDAMQDEGPAERIMRTLRDDRKRRRIDRNRNQPLFDSAALLACTSVDQLATDADAALRRAVRDERALSDMVELLDIIFQSVCVLLPTVALRQKALEETNDSSAAADDEALSIASVINDIELEISVRFDRSDQSHDAVADGDRERVRAIVQRHAAWLPSDFLTIK